MSDVKKLAEEYAHDLLECDKITSEQWNIIVDAILYGNKIAIQNLSNIKDSDGVYLIPNPLPIGRR